MSSWQERGRFPTSAEGLCGARGCSRRWWHHKVLLASPWGNMQRPGGPQGPRWSQGRKRMRSQVVHDCLLPASTPSVPPFVPKEM